MAIFCFNDTATTEIYTLSLHDALPICSPDDGLRGAAGEALEDPAGDRGGSGGTEPGLLHHHGDDVLGGVGGGERSEEHTAELQSRQYLVCRLLLEKKTYRSSVSLRLSI